MKFLSFIIILSLRFNYQTKVWPKKTPIHPKKKFPSLCIYRFGGEEGLEITQKNNFAKLSSKLLRYGNSPTKFIFDFLIVEYREIINLDMRSKDCEIGIWTPVKRHIHPRENLSFNNVQNPHLEPGIYYLALLIFAWNLLFLFMLS